MAGGYELVIITGPVTQDTDIFLDGVHLTRVRRLELVVDADDPHARTKVRLELIPEKVTLLASETDINWDVLDGEAYRAYCAAKRREREANH